MSNKGPDIEGLRFGRLLVLKEVAPYRNPRGWIRGRKYFCQCDCGNQTEVHRGSLLKMATKSCGCLLVESTKNRSITHGRSHTKIHVVWRNMIKRCTKPTNKHYVNYGGREITVCDRWLHGFENFVVDMGEVPPGKTLDRIDNNGNYEPGNCRWATRKEQTDNRRNSIVVEINGQHMRMKEAAEYLGIPYSTFKNKYRRLGLSVEEIITTYTGER